MKAATQGRQRTPASARSSHSASLSIVVVSSDSANGLRAARTLTQASAGIAAELIIVSRDADESFAASVTRSGVEFVAAPEGCTRAEMCDLGMTHANGAIVALRDDVDVGDAAWLDAYRALLPGIEARSAVAETVVMDAQVAIRAPLADAPAPSSPQSGARGAAIEMAAAV